MSEYLTVAEATADGWIAINEHGVRISIPGKASRLQLRPGQRVIADLDGDRVSSVRIGPVSLLSVPESSLA